MSIHMFFFKFDLYSTCNLGYKQTLQHMRTCPKSTDPLRGHEENNI